MTDPRNLPSILNLTDPTHQLATMSLGDMVMSSALVQAESDLRPPSVLLREFVGRLGSPAVPFAIQVLLTRLEAEAPSLRISESLVVWVAMQMSAVQKQSGRQPGPGDAVLWAHAIVRVWLSLGSPDEGVRLSDLILAFEAPPSAAGLLYVWEAQKRSVEHRRANPGNDNWLDYSREPWRTIPEGYILRTGDNMAPPEPTPDCDCFACSTLREAMAAQGDQPEVAPTRH